jgi:hypothetical protein
MNPQPSELERRQFSLDDAIIKLHDESRRLMYADSNSLTGRQKMNILEE